MIMKKLKLILNDVGEILTREQLKQVFGGSGSGGNGTCGWSGISGPGSGFCGIDIGTAQSLAQEHPGTTWCCDSCSTTLYCGPDSGW
ncbi:hypothetical protein EL17_10990 [Anditalea andensis]|uniref:Uncharacterized protein n=2 Tax=Anditalea andensis TaxID=1048983 RepID=A0A074LIR2_9BACT|nr:hypothetical protein EL17_10990 [Anditalea andensis]